MPIHVLRVERDESGRVNLDTLKAWINEYVVDRDYAMLVTEEGEIILEPRKSTRPIDYGYIRLKSFEEACSIAAELERLYGFKRIIIQSFAWDIEKPPWVKIPVE